MSFNVQIGIYSLQRYAYHDMSLQSVLEYNSILTKCLAKIFHNKARATKQTESNWRMRIILDILRNRNGLHILEIS